MSSEINRTALAKENHKITVQIFDQEGVALDVTDYATTDLTYYFGEKGATPEILTIGSGITKITAASGIIQISIPSADLNITSGNYSHELWNLKSGFVEPIFTGTLTVRRSLYSGV